MSSAPNEPITQITKIKIGLALIFALVSWASALVFIRIGLQGGYSPGSLALLRYLIGSTAMFLIVLPQIRHLKINKKLILPLLINGIIGIGIYNITLNYGEITINAGTAGFIIGQIPVLTVLLSVIFLKEKNSRLGWIGILISFLGITLIAVSHHEGFTLNGGVISLLIATLCGATYIVYSKSLLTKLNPLALTSYSFWGGTLFLLIFFPNLLDELPKASHSATWSAVYLGLAPGCLGYMAWTYVLRYLPASRTTRFLYISPLLTMILGWLILSEIPEFLAITGGLIALTGAVLTGQSKKN